ncbi:MAG TPA: sugar phosphate nucleotidyltransferase [Vicinamibacterales bacterium]|jgi:NDP-sugar pyrophosphorylase family protein
MQVVVLAGGLGTRLWPLTRQCPKPMVPVAGAPFLEHQLRMLARQGFDDIVLLTGYLGEQIEEHFSDGASLGLRVRYSREPAPLGTGGALRLARPLLAETFLLLYGDSYLPIDYRSVADHLDSTQALGVLVAHRASPAAGGLTGNLVTNDEGFLVCYDKRPDREGDFPYVDAGVLALRRAVVDLVGAGRVSLEERIFPALAARRALLVVPTTERFYDIGTMAGLAAIQPVLG